MEGRGGHPCVWNGVDEASVAAHLRKIGSLVEGLEGGLGMRFGFGITWREESIEWANTFKVQVDVNPRPVNAIIKGVLPSENIHVHIPRGIGTENLVPQVLVRLFKPREMEIDQRAIIIVGPQHPFPVRMMHSPSIAPPNKPIRKLLRLPTLMNNLWYRSIDRTQRSLHQLGRRQIFGLWKTYLIRGTLNLRFDSRTRNIQSHQVE
jgi:hypothetical protein